MQMKKIEAASKQWAGRPGMTTRAGYPAMPPTVESTMTTPTHITTVDQRSALLNAVECLLERQLPAEPIAYVWPEQHRILFRTAGDRTGSVDVLVNFDVVPIAQDCAATNYSAPAPTEPTATVHPQTESTKAA